MAGARHASRRRYVLFVLVLSALTLITLDTRHGRSGAVGAMGRAAHTIVGPVEGAVSSALSPVSDWWHGVTDSGHLKSENRKLRQKISVLEGRDRSAQQEIDDGEQLKKLLGLDSTLNVKHVAGRIIGRDPGNFDSTLTIDRGTERGIAKDMPVIAPDGSLVGTVVEAGRGYAKVRVLTDPEFAVGVKLPAHPGSDATTSIAQGQVGSRELIDVLDDPQKKVMPGDSILTSPSSQNLYPPDLQVGSVTRVEPQPGNQVQHVFIRPYVDLGALEYVSVLLWVQGQGAVVRTTTTTTVPASTTTTTTKGG